ncbi:LysE family translocator [Allokutzneria albata]|uniref:Threonine/homoserine/homoserine lactone efflux protein n=1 Tax=Allokutzneria albata TaxID=211114 RepID=A0A1G9V036_ALLAB|nr:LysE family translocator [Allokutzneria albata]SDM65564.1 Threonine/homoserine/homoserine lactone efflux protein [Allokutzneria albata]
MNVAEFVVFLGVSFAVIATPGQDTVLTVRNALVGGRRGGVLTAAGVAAGQAVWAVAAATGVAGVIRASESLFVAIKLVGAAYLVLLGVRSLWSACRGERLEHVAAAPAGRAFRQGLLSNLANPKMAVFFISLLPQFGEHSGLPTMLLLGAIFCAITFCWLVLYGWAVVAARHVLTRPVVRRWMDGVSGCLLVGLGARLGLQRV